MALLWACTLQGAAATTMRDKSRHLLQSVCSRGTLLLCSTACKGKWLRLRLDGASHRQRLGVHDVSGCLLSVVIGL